MTATAHPRYCAGCNAALNPHNITRLCAECKLVARNRRLTGQPVDTTEPVSHREAIAAVTAILGGRIITEHSR